MSKRISWWRTSFGRDEARKIAESIANEHISQGLVTEAFEKAVAEKLGIPYVVATTSGSMAIVISLLAAGVKPGDEVIVPNRTWIATAHAPLLLGAKPVLVDVEPGQPIIDVKQIENKITKKTKVILPVHLNGRSVDISKINKIAKKHNLLVIEDAAQSFCSKNKSVFLGTQSFAGCFSLAVAKIISTGQGGFVVTKNKKIYEELKLIRTHGITDFINVTYHRFGFNFRFTDIQASIGIVQLKQVEKRVENVIKIYKKYAESIKDLPFLKLIPVDLKSGEVPIYIEVLCPQRDKLVKYLDKHGVQTRPFYPDLNLSPYLKTPEKFPNSEVFGKQGLFLPCGPAQPLENVDRVIKVLKGFK